MQTDYLFHGIKGFERFAYYCYRYDMISQEAQEVFLDPMHISKLDHRFDYFEERWITLGATTKDKILVIANMFFNDNGEEIIRIISARKANDKERIFYEQH